MKTNTIYCSLLVIALSFTQCKEASKKEKELPKAVQHIVSTINTQVYGTTAEGVQVDQYSLKNSNGMQVDIITYGGRITSLKTADRNGDFANITLGFNSLEQYQQDNPFFGALVGRYGNRIADAQFSLDGNAYTLAKNNGENNLHGGVIGYDKVVWKVEEAKGGDTALLKLSYLSKDMEEGFPGNLSVMVIYTLSNDNTLEVAYEATTDKKTVVNLTQHTYFNLSGDFSKSILDHELTLDAATYLPVNEALIPTGELATVTGTPFDFTVTKIIGKEINIENDQIAKGGGYDHCWVLKKQDTGMRSVAFVHHPASGRTMEVITTEPGMQFYTGNFLDGTLPATTGGFYQTRSGFCLETQHYPDSPNQTDFPSVVLIPGVKYETKTAFKFSLK